MEKIYIFGHKKPDTDSVTSAIALSYLKNKLGYNTEPFIIGNLNNETKFVLKYFKVDKPKYLNDVKLQIKDINYDRGCYLSEKSSIYEVYNFMNSKELTGLPIINENNNLVGMATLKGIFRELIDSIIRDLNTSYNNILNTIEGQEILRFNDEIKGEILVASYRSTSFIENVKIGSDTILIVGDRHSIIEYAIESKVKMLIITGGNQMKDEHLKRAKENKVNIIKTDLNTFNVAKLIELSNYISTILNKDEELTTFDENDFINSFVDISNRLKYTNYPIVNRNNKCYGLLKINDISDKRKKKVILVDHNEGEQSVDGLEEAEILEIIDHHKIGNVNTTNPINFRNMAVGSTNTIVYNLYKENKVEIPKEIAGIMLSGIISDTLLFSSPTTTSLDKEAAKELEKLAKIDMKEYGMEMLKAGTSIVGKTKEEVLYNDFKEFNVNNRKIGIGQIFTMNFDEIKKDIDDYVKLIEDTVKNNNYYMINLYITDIVKKGSYVLYNENSKELLENCLNIRDLYQGYYIDGVVSRKKQVIPYIMDEL